MFVEISVLQLVDIVGYIRRSGGYVGGFLGDKPLSCNYKIIRSVSPFGVAFFCGGLVGWGVSLNVFEEHISVVGLTMECKVLLSESQSNLLMELLDL